MTTNICIAGVTGWAGSALARAVHEAPDLNLSGAVARKSAGRPLSEVLGIHDHQVVVSDTVDRTSLAGCDVLVEYTSPLVAKTHILTALDAGVHVVVGTSGLSDADYAEIHERALERKRGVLAAGNFALTVVLLQKFAETAARYIPHWEILDYAHDDKVDAPSGTVRELAHRLSRVRAPEITVPLDQVQGEKEARGATLSGSQVHSIRLPGFVISVEAIFGMAGQKLSIRHDAGTSAQPYVDGALLAVRKVHTFTGLRRGLDQVMDF